MTVKTTLSFTDRHHQFLKEKVQQGIFATSSAAVAAAVEQMIDDEVARETALSAMAEEINMRMQTSSRDFVDLDVAFSAVKSRFSDE